MTYLADTMTNNALRTPAALPMTRPAWSRILRRLYWDLMDREERTYYIFWAISGLPGAFGSLLRARYLARKMKASGMNLRVLAGCRFRSLERLEIGNNVSIGFDNFLQARGGLTIGNNVMTAPGVKIWSVNHDYDDAETPVELQGVSMNPVVIGDNVFLASNAFIMPGVVLPEGCVVSAGAVVGVKAYRPYSILAGNPARVIGFRGDRGEYKAEGPA